MLQIGSTKRNHFIRTKDRIHMTGSCPYNDLCVYTKMSNADLNYTHLKLPIEANSVQEMLVYPDTVVLVDYSNKVYVLGQDMCSSNKHFDSWHLFEASHAEQLYFGANVTLAAQQGKIMMCTSSNPKPTTLLNDLGSVTKLAGHNEAAMIASEKGLWVVGENKNNQMGACEKDVNGVCKL